MTQHKIKRSRFDELSTSTLYNILKLRVDVFVVEQNCPYPELDDRDQEARHFYFESNSTIVAYLRVYFPEKHRAAIGRVAVHTDYRKDGFGRKLMEQAMGYLRGQRDIQSVYLQAQDYLIEFYESFGFQRTSEVYLEDGIPHIDMENILGKTDKG